MRKKSINIMPKPLFTLLVLCVLLLSGTTAWADGSKDLYPSGKTGVRAYLRAHNAANANWPFANYGTHYVYAVAGETITLASSVQGNGGTSRIRLYAPDGSEIVSNTTDGLISNRNAELAGPRLVGEPAGGNKYLPIYYTVTTTGLYRVEFVGRQTGDPSNTYQANANWTQPTNNAAIVAWDISVINSANNGFIKGRVYTNVLNLSNGTASPNTQGFEGIIYVLTKDGYTYRVDNNGNNGMYFTFYVNNNGYVDGPTQEPLYKSLNKSTGFGNQAHDPNIADTERHITHKMFYTLPSTDLPTSASGAVPGGTTWLKNEVIEPNVSQVEIFGVDGTAGQVGNKGGYIKFLAGAQGQYTITIESTDIPKKFVTRVLTGSSVAGQNSILWDGKDGDGNPLPIGDAPSRVTVQLQGAEVHFPFIDMEYNRLGTKVELLDHIELANTGNEVVESDTVYWNDIDIAYGTGGGRGSIPIPINNSHLTSTYDGTVTEGDGNGTSSNVNGHIWGVGGSGTSGQFGDNKAIDTWTFIKGVEQTLETTVVVKVADLEIPSVIPSKTFLKIGDEVTYYIKARNNGPSDVDAAPFSFIIPEGFDPNSISFNGNGCGTENTTLQYDPITRTYSSTLALPDGCEVIYSINLEVNAIITVGQHEFTATIMRPDDVTDPDATNPDPNVPPTDPFYECDNNGLPEYCNNIKSVLVEYQILGYCYEEVAGETFEWNYGSYPDPTVTKEITQPGTNAGFIFDIYELDNSFNMTINGILLATQEIEFQSSGGLTQNIKFADGTIWEDGIIEDIWKLVGEPGKPIVRVEIKPNGTIQMFGSKVSSSNTNYELLPLELFGGNTFNPLAWNETTDNNIIVSQNVVGATKMKGYGSGQNLVDCETYTLEKEGVFNDENNDGLAQVGETITYTLTVKNAGDIDIYNLTVEDPMLGGVITATPTGDTNSDGILNIDEVWVYTVNYSLTQADIDNKGVYNLASVAGKNILDEDLDPETSVDPSPLDPTDPNYDPTRPDHTFVPLKGTSLLITNPNIYHKVKRN